MDEGGGLLAAGVDGCRAGWVVATARVDGSGPTHVEVVATIAEVIGRALDGTLAAVGVDMPIGLPFEGPRVCDVEARRRLGPRRSSVFPTPPRAVVVGCETWRPGLGLNKQTFNLLAKMREVDAVMTPALQDRMVEVHPELCFATMAGAPMVHPKRSAPGQAERALALRMKDPPHRLPGTQVDDVLDARAVLWTARRLARGRAERLGDGAVDGRGLRMEIVV
jgi:predicted RNase H-like nuclease